MDGFLKKIPPRLFAEWRAYYQLEPFGHARADVRIAALERALYNIFTCDWKTRPKGYDLEEFIQRVGDQNPPKPKKKNDDAHAQMLRNKASLAQLASLHALTPPSDRETIKRPRKRG